MKFVKLIILGSTALEEYITKQMQEIPRSFTSTAAVVFKDSFVL